MSRESSNFGLIERESGSSFAKQIYALRIEVVENETPKERIERISTDLKSAFDEGNGETKVKWENFIQRCRHETGDFYSSSDKKIRTATFVCDQYPKGITTTIDRNASNKQVTVIDPITKKTVALTRGKVPIYGGYNYTNVNAKSKYMTGEVIFGSMASKDVEISPDGKKTPIDFNLYIFKDNEHFVTTMLSRLQTAGVTNEDDMMTMMAKLSAKTGFNGFGEERIIRYANSGYLREAKYITDGHDADKIRCVVPTGWTLSKVRKVIKQQLDDAFMNDLKGQCPNLHKQYEAFLKGKDAEIDKIPMKVIETLDRATYENENKNEKKSYTIFELPDLSNLPAIKKK